METMDCESPENSVSESEGVPAKKPKVAAKIKPTVRNAAKISSVWKGKKILRPAPLAPVNQNAMDVRESESSGSSLEMDNKNNMALENWNPESDKENRKRASQSAKNVSELNFQIHEGDISQMEIEYLIHLENGGLVSPKTQEAFKVHRAEQNKTNVTSLSETDGNSVGEINVKNKKKTPPKLRPKRLRPLKQRAPVRFDTSDESDRTDRENESVAIKHKPLKIKKARPSTSATVSRVRNTPVEEYDDEADDEPELIRETEVSKSVKKKAVSRKKLIMKPNGQDNTVGATDEEIEDTIDENDEAIALMTQLSDNLIAQLQEIKGFEIEDTDDDKDDIFEEVEPGFQSNDCKEFTEVLKINNNNEDDLAIPGCSKTPDQLPLNDFDSDSDIDQPGPSKRPTKRLRKPSETNSSDSETDGEDGTIQATRKANKKRMRNLMKKFRYEQTDLKVDLNQRKGKNLKKGKAPLKRKRGSNGGDSSYRSRCNIPAEKRRSSRLQSKRPEYNHEALDEVQETLKHLYFRRPDYNLDDNLPEELDNLERIIRKPKRRLLKRKVEEHIIIPVEEVTQEMLNNIALRVKGKVYTADGTTCHQCRQKTRDQKTCCRSPYCSGMMGMFCGVCIKNRYGENADEALLNPNWICPVCRGKCNCSICRTKQGKRPTGILAPLAQQSGYESVDHFLDNLRGEGDRAKDDHKYQFKRDPEALLGFSNDGNKAHLQDGSSYSMRCTLCILKECNNSNNVLGFSKDGNYVLMGGRRLEPLFKPKTFFFSLLRLQHIHI